jgi:1,4-alpha-glucan branching enzyme
VLTKNWNAETGRYDVTFDLPAELDIEQAAVVGEFNDWSESANPMTTADDGRWTATISLDPGRSFRFRYHLGKDRWENDWNADHYVGNDFGGADSVVVVPEQPTAPPPAKAAAKRAATKKAPAKKAAPKKAAKKKAAAKKSTKKAAKKATKKAPPEQG